ncbi:MAG TPA: DUF1499 domain-containing protein [Gemmatimonadota bacterium]|nr:DUF1499 domain-containing protein [Gemmatimonadota bacterium]
MKGSVGRILSRLTVHAVETGTTPAYPDLRPLTIPRDADTVYRAALETARRMPGWTIVARSPADRFLHAEARTRCLKFIDDVRIRVEEGAEGGSRVAVRSASRVGVFDFGANARRIRSYLERLDRDLG